MTDNELVWRLTERIEELAGMVGQGSARHAPDNTEVETLRRELSEVKAKHDIILHELRQAECDLAVRSSVHVPEPNEKLDAVMDKIKQAVTALDWIDDEVAKTRTFIVSNDISIMLTEIREAIGWARPEVKAS